MDTITVTLPLHLQYRRISTAKITVSSVNVADTNLGVCEWAKGTVPCGTTAAISVNPQHSLL